MGKRAFLVSGNWCWDHSNTEILTFTIEGDEKEENYGDPLPINEPLTPVTFPKYYRKYDGTIKHYIEEGLKAIDGSIMGQIEPGSLYEIKDGGITIPAGNESLNLELTWLCLIKRNDKNEITISNRHI